MKRLAFAAALLWSACAWAQPHSNPQLGDIWLYFGPTLGAGWGDNPTTSAIPNNTVLGNVSGVAAPVSALNATQLTTLCNVFSSSLKGCVPASGGSATTFLNGAGGFTTPAGTGITQLTGDVTAGPGSGSVATTLANTAVTPGSYTSTNLTVDAKGRITAAANGSGGGITGSGTINYVAKFTGATSVGDSGVTDTATLITALKPVTINPPVSYLGAELLSNPTFVANSTGWTLASADTTWAAGQFTTTCSCDDAALSTAFASVSGNTYLVTYDFTITGDQSYIRFSNNTAFSPPLISGARSFAFVADYTGSDTIIFDLYNYNTGAVRVINSPVSVRQISPLSNNLSVLSFDNTCYLCIDRQSGIVTVGDGGQSQSNFGANPIVLTVPMARELLINGSADGGAGATPGNISIVGANASTGNNYGSSLTFQAGSGVGTGQGGGAFLSAGTSATQVGGPLTLSAGYSSGGAGGSATLSAGMSGAVGSAGGSVFITGGNAFLDGNGGNITLTTGDANGTGNAGNIEINGNSVTGSGNYGTISVLGRDILLSSSQTTAILLKGGAVGVGTITSPERPTGISGEFALADTEGQGASAPGAGWLKLRSLAGTNAGTCKLVTYAGTSTTPIVIVDNVGTGC